MGAAPTEYALLFTISGGAGVSICSISEIVLTGSANRSLMSETDGGELPFSARVWDPLFIPQIAAWVRFWTRILRSIAFT